MMCLRVDHFGFILIGTLCASWTSLTFSFTRFGKFSVIIYLFKQVLCFLLMFLSLQDSYDVDIMFYVPKFYLIFQSLVWFDQSAFNSQGILYARYGILHLWLVLVHGFYFLFRAVQVPTKFLAVLTKFLQHPYNIYFELYILNCLPPLYLALFLEFPSSFKFGGGFFVSPFCCPFVFVSMC